jgi:hypothetical protein
LQNDLEEYDELDAAMADFDIHLDRLENEIKQMMMDIASK